jgi:hypothetical protein
MHRREEQENCMSKRSRQTEASERSAGENGSRSHTHSPSALRAALEKIRRDDNHPWKDPPWHFSILGLILYVHLLLTIGVFALHPTKKVILPYVPDGCGC